MPKDRSIKTVYYFNAKQLTLSELIDLNIPPNARITSLHYSYDRPETFEEYEKRMKWNADQDERHSNWEKETYAKLYEKFEGQAPNATPI